jgi:hypothetical protein
LCNVSNSSIFGDNAVFVMVNVLGHWVGKIMDVPGGASECALLGGNTTVGSTAGGNAALTGGGSATVDGTGPASTNQAGVNNSSTANINQSSVGSITNNVNANAQSGDASASDNTKVGNITSGIAKAATNVGNFFNSALNLKHWFGVLVINVFGDWTGDVNHDSAAGNAKPSSPSTDQVTNAAVAAAQASVAPLAHGQVVSGDSGSGGNLDGGAGGSADQSPQVVATNKVLTAAAHNSGTGTAAAVAKGKDMSLLFGISAVVLLLAGATASVERKLRRK